MGKTKSYQNKQVAKLNQEIIIPNFKKKYIHKRKPWLFSKIEKKIKVLKK